MAEQSSLQPLGPLQAEQAQWRGAHGMEAHSTLEPVALGKLSFQLT